MTDQDDFARAYEHLSAALILLDRLNVHAAAADAAQALHRLQQHPLARGLAPNSGD